MSRRGDSSSPTLGLVLIRAFTGWVLLSHGWRWLREGQLDGRTIERAIERSLREVGPMLEWWGESVLLYNPDAIAFFCRWGAFAAGLCLFLGGLTRPLGLIAAFFLANAFAFGPESEHLLFLVLLVTCLGCAFAGAGRRLGLDAIFDQHFPSWLTWRRSRGSSSFLS